MKRIFATLLFALALILPAPAHAQYLGSWKIDDFLTFAAVTSDPDTGCADADSAPAYRVYEDETSTPIVTGTMALLDSSNTCGFYTERVQLTAASGFEKGKAYTVYIQAVVSTVTGATTRTFQMEAEVDANTVSNITTGSFNSGAINAAALATDAITAAKVASDVTTELQTGIATIKKNTAYTSFPVWMLDAAGAGVTGLSTAAITCRVQLDAGSFSITNDTTETEIGRGLYVIDLLSSETNGNTFNLDCAATGAITYRYSVATQR